MGYRSDVALAMRKETFKAMLSSVKDDRTAVELVSGCEQYEKDDFILLFYKDVKWYEDFKEVKAINEFIDTLDETQYSYHVMGEDFEDYSDRGYLDNPFEISLSRSLEFNI
jgi:hypothetical protein